MEDYNNAANKLDQLSEINVNYFDTQIEFTEPIDRMLFNLSDGDLSKAALIETLDRDRCYEWVYFNMVRELNSMKVKIEEITKLKKELKK